MNIPISKYGAWRQINYNVKRAKFRRFVKYMKKEPSLKIFYDGFADRTVFLKFDRYKPKSSEFIELCLQKNIEMANNCMKQIADMLTFESSSEDFVIN